MTSSSKISRRTWVSVLVLLAVVPQPRATGSNEGKPELYDESYRPQFHFTPAENWMNDPNGPIYYKGEYHLFYQYNPFAAKWGHMSWGHAVSRDMVHWKPLPLALSEENGIVMFSGSTVVDWHNSSGFCGTAKGGNSSCLIAIYSGHSDHLQTQNLAYSNDNGRTWTKYGGNPVIDLHLAGFRDPKVFWFEQTHRWIMVVSLASQHKIRFFASPDLKRWTPLSDFGPAGAIGGAWECPDFFALPIEGEPNQIKWVLSINLNPGGIAGGSGNQYFVGAFDGTTFTSEMPANETLWADYGPDFYASTSFSDLPKSDKRHVWLGWLSNWQYGPNVPTSPWKGVQSIPRELKLRRYPNGVRLVQEPIAELEVLRDRHTYLKDQNVEAANKFLDSKNVRRETFEIAAEIMPENAQEFGLKVRVGDGEETVIGIDVKKHTLFVDRTRSGDASFDEHFAARHDGPITLRAGKSVKLRVFVDRASVEVFGNNGETVLSEAIFPKSSSDRIKLYSQGGNPHILKMDVWNLKSVYRQDEVSTH